MHNVIPLNVHTIGTIVAVRLQFNILNLLAKLSLRGGFLHIMINGVITARTNLVRVVPIGTERASGSWFRVPSLRYFSASTFGILDNPTLAKKAKAPKKN